MLPYFVRELGHFSQIITFSKKNFCQITLFQSYLANTFLDLISRDEIY